MTLYKQNSLEKFIIFSIYQNYTLALSKYPRAFIIKSIIQLVYMTGECFMG